MIKTHLSKSTLVVVILGLALVASGKQAKERVAFGFEEVQAEATKLAQVAGDRSKVLLVFDIDNTLLAMNQDLGSDQWYDWQKSLPDSHACKVENQVGMKLLEVQGYLYSIGSMRATDPLNQARIVRELQRDGFRTLILTSRGPDFRAATIRELIANGFDFRGSCLGPSEGFSETYMPYKKDEVDRSGISLDEANQWLNKDGAIKEPRAVSYRDGVYMTAGQHKGAMLRMLLHKTGNEGKFSHLIFVDDKARHTASVRAAYASEATASATTFRYTREDGNVARFENDQCGEKCCASIALNQLVRVPSSSNVSRHNPAVWPVVISSDSSSLGNRTLESSIHQ